MGDSDKLMDVESGQKEAYEEELPSDDEEGGKVCLIWFVIRIEYRRISFSWSEPTSYNDKLTFRLQMQ